ncbi:MAG: hypothetical protein P8188_13960 [Gemmatimonadota bacterium]
MKKLAIVPILLLLGCSPDVTVPERPDAWQLDVQSPRVRVDDGARAVPTPPVAEGRSDRGKPLSVLTSDEVATRPVDGLRLQGVSFDYDGPDARYNSPNGPDRNQFVDCPCIEGSTAGVLTITFDKPTQVVGFGAAVLAASVVQDAFTVEVVGPNGRSRGVFPVTTVPSPDFSAALFHYDRNAVKQLRIFFNPTTNRFTVDNITYHQAPR